VSWEPPRITERNGQLSYYTVCIIETQLAYYDNGSIAQLASVNSDPLCYDVSEDLTYVIRDLHPSYEYNISVAAATRTGVGPFIYIGDRIRLPFDGEFLTT